MAERYYQITAIKGKTIKHYETPEKEIPLMLTQIENDIGHCDELSIKNITPDLFMHYRKSKIEKILQAA